MIRNRDLFWKLTEPEHLRARAFCRKLLGNRDDGDDLYQDALVTALTKFENLRETAAFRSWLYRIIVNSFRNRMRQPWWKRYSRLTEKIADTVAGDNPVAEHAAKRRLQVAFRAVKPEDRALVTLFELEGWSIFEIAKMQYKSEAAIKMRLSRARQKMRVALAKATARANDGTKSKTADNEENKENKLSEDRLCVAAKPSLD